MPPNGQPDQYADFLFPVNGLDLYQTFMNQRPGTTPVGKNVRAYEPGTQRARGGARPGLSKWIPPQLPSGAHLIQHLNYIVDPTPAAIDDVSADPSTTDTVDDPTTNPPGSDPNNDNDHTVRIRPPRHVRRGGWGHRPNRNTKRKSKTIKFVQSNNNSLTGSTGNIAYTSNVAMGDLLVFALMSASGTVSVTDTLGNAWTQIGPSVRCPNPFQLTLWGCISLGNGANTVSWTASGSTQSIFGVLEYSGVNAPSFLDQTASNTNATSDGAGNELLGPINVALSGELVIAAYVSNAFLTGLVGTAGWNQRINNPAFAAESLLVQDLIGVASAQSPTIVEANGTTPCGYCSLGASFFHG